MGSEMCIRDRVDGTQSPAFTIAKSALNTNFAAVGDSLNYEYLVRNTGNVEITNIAVADDKIASVSCPVTTLMPTDTTICTGTYTVTQADIDAGAVTNIAEVSGTPTGGTLTPVSDIVTVSGTQTSSLEIAKTALTTNFTAVGDLLDYEYVVTNTGNTTITTAISVNDDKIAPPAAVSCDPIPAGGLIPNDSVICLSLIHI